MGMDMHMSICRACSGITNAVYASSSKIVQSHTVRKLPSGVSTNADSLLVSG